MVRACMVRVCARVVWCGVRAYGCVPGACVCSGLVLMRPESKEGRMQKGLMRVEANPSGRRMIAIPLGQTELWGLVKARAPSRGTTYQCAAVA